MNGPSQFVTQADSNALIAAVESAAANPRAGMFGPESVSWKINRESALFLGAGRAALLQLAHPWVATALEQHSSLMSRPIERFHSTFRIVFTTIFGSVDQATAASRHLYRLHTNIEGDLQHSVGDFAKGSHYQANEIAALRWVYATLIESAVCAYNFVLPPLSPIECEQYYAESLKLAALFGLPASAMPATWISFLAYCREMEQSAQLGVTPEARGMADGLLRGAGSWIKPPQWYRALTTSWLPERLRDEFQLVFTGADQGSIGRAQRWLPYVYRSLPAALRFVGPWHEAQARLSGKLPRSFTQASNRFWIGQSRMPFSS